MYSILTYVKYTGSAIIAYNWSEHVWSDLACWIERDG